METTNSNITSPSKPKSKFSSNLQILENPDSFQKRVFKKYSEDLTQYLEQAQPSNNISTRLNEIRRKKFATLTPLLTPRNLITTSNKLMNPSSACVAFIPQSNFKKLKKLCTGCQALNCFKCIDVRNNQTVVVKEIKNNDEEICMQFQAEYKFIKALDHKNIIKAIELLTEGDISQLVMEYALGKQLSHYVIKLTENQILNISKQLFSALSYLHSRKIMHRDLHLKNIIYEKSSGNVKIVDFGIAKELRDRAFGASCAGGIEYRAPEMLNYQPYSCKIDCWQCGLILLQLVNNKNTTSQRIMKKIENQKNIFKKEIQSKQLKILIESLLVINSDNRVSAEEALNLLQDF